MTINAARELRDGQVCLVGVGPPNAAANLARRLHAPDCVLVYESGAIGAKPRAAAAVDRRRRPRRDRRRARLRAGDVQLLGRRRPHRRRLPRRRADRPQGNINTTVIGDYDTPKVRLPGAGGAPEIAAERARGDRRSCASPAHVRREARLHHLHIDTPGPGARPMVVITDLGILERDAGDGELELTALHGEIRSSRPRGDRLGAAHRGRAAAHAGAERRGAQDTARAPRALASSAGSQPPTRLPARASAAALPMTSSRPGPTPTRLIGTPAESEIAPR